MTRCHLVIRNIFVCQENHKCCESINCIAFEICFSMIAAANGTEQCENDEIDNCSKKALHCESKSDCNCTCNAGGNQDFISVLINGCLLNLNFFVSYQAIHNTGCSLHYHVHQLSFCLFFLIIACDPHKVKGGGIIGRFLAKMVKFSTFQHLHTQNNLQNALAFLSCFCYN